MIMPKNEEHPKNLSLEAKATVSIEAKAAEGDGPAPLPRFDMLANTGAPMRLAGWKYPVVVDLAGLSIPSQARPVRYGHDANAGVGHTDSIAVANGQLTATGVVSRDTPQAKEIVASSANGFPWQASIGASVEESEFIKGDQSVTVNGQKLSGPLNVVTKSTLGEISFVDLGADGNTKARVAAMAKDGEQDPGITGGNGHAPIDGAQAVDQALERYEKEQQRQKAIETLVLEALGYRGADSTAIRAISRKALDENWEVQKTHLELVLARRAHAPAARGQDLPTPKVLEAALCMAAGISDEKIAKDRDYGPDIAAQAWPLRTRGLRGTIAAALEAGGVRVPYGNRELYDAILDNRHNRSIQAEGFSTVNLPGILGSVANKILLDAFLQFDATYEIIAQQADFSNFHVHSIYRLEATGDFAKVPSTGELKNAVLGEDSYSNQLDTRGLILTISRKMIINDDMNAFKDLTASLARKARVGIEKALYDTLMEASDVFYTTARGNRLTGALGLTELAAAETAMMSMTDLNGDPIMATPQIVLVPPGLKSYATSIFLSELLQGATSSAKGQPAGNPFRGRFQVVSSPFLAASSLAGSSATTWYLLANPNMLPALQVAYLDGRRAPTTETRDAEFDVLGLQMRCYWDFGVAALDYRGIVKSTAA
jgi:hypothetical protein